MQALIRRAADVAAPGAWCLPGGGVRCDEPHADAMVRELQEELGVTVEPIGVLWRCTLEEGALRLYFWRVRLVDENADLTPDPGEVAEVRWCTPAEALALPALLESNRAFLQYWQSGRAGTST
jgi:8-oxo-dGTP diphosphatase